MKKAIGMFSALLVALAMTGVGFSHWEKTVTINGTVTTGTLELEPSCNIWVVSPTDKPWVASVENTLDIAGNTVSYSIGNAFPCLTVGGEFDLLGIGSVPAGLKEIYINLPWGVSMVPGPVTDNYEIYDNTLPPGENLIANFKLTFDGDFNQIDQGQTATANWEIHFKENLPQDTQYDFQMTLVYWNWNEVNIGNPIINWGHVGHGA